MTSAVNKYLKAQQEVHRTKTILLEKTNILLGLLGDKDELIVRAAGKQKLLVRNNRTKNIILKDDCVSTTRKRVIPEYAQILISTSETIDMATLKRLIESSKIPPSIIDEITISSESTELEVTLCPD